MNDKRDQLYDNLINSGRVSEAEIGNRDEFKAAIKDEAASRLFYNNIINSGALTADEIGSEDDFYNSISSDFASAPAPQGYKPTADEMAGFMSTINNAGKAVKGIAGFDQRAQNLKKRQGLNVPKRVNLGESNNLVEGQQRLNPETGELENTYITSSGNEYDNKALADMEQRERDQFVRDQKYLQSIPGQLEKAYEERDRLNQMAEARRKQIEEEKSNEGFMTNLLREAGRAAQSDKIPDNTSYSADWENDREYSNIMAAIRKNNELITTLEDQRDNETNGFWHSFGTEVANGYTFSLGGKTRMDDVIALTEAQKHIDNINKKRSNGEALTQEEEIAEAVLKNNEWDREIQGKYGDEYGAWARAGKMGANSADFMLDFLMMGGMPAGMAKNIMGAVVKGGERYLGNLATKGFGRFMLKATGATLGSMVAGAEITNTIQLGKTSSDLAQSMMGDVYQDENGNYVFGHYEEDENGEPKFVDGGNDFFTALAEVQRSGISENGSEILGTFLPGGGKALSSAGSQILEKLGLSKISRGLTALTGKKWFQNYNKFLETAGFNGVVGEGMEEYAGTVLDWMMGGNEWKNLADPSTHVDIWLGVTTMSGVLNAPNLIGTGYSAAQYQRYKKATDKSDAVASAMMDTETWNSLRETIDNTDNANMADVAMGILSNNDLSVEGKRAAMDYISNLQKMRGYSLGSIAAGKDDGETQGETEASRMVDESYTEGYDTQEPDLLKQFNDEAQQAASNLSQYGEEFAKEVIDSQDPVRELDYLMNFRDKYFSDEQIAAAADYYQKMSRINGAMDGALSRIDLEIERRKAETRSNTHQQSGDVILAKVGEGDFYVIAGDIVTDENGMTSLAGTGGAVVVKDSITGEVSVKSPQEVMVYSMQPSEQIQNYYDTEVRKAMMKQADDDFTYGSPASEEFQLEDTVILNDGEGNMIEGQVVGMPNAIDGVYSVQTGNSVQYFTADQLNRMIVAHNGQEVQRASQQQMEQQEPEIEQNQDTLEQNQAETEQNQPQNEQGGVLDNAGAEASAENGTGADDAPATALSRIPITTDAQGKPILNKKGKPQYQWHKASVEDAAAALIETTGGDKVMARDTASDLVKNAQAGLEKIRKQKPKGDDPIEIAESRMEIKRQEQEQQAIIKQWQDVNQAIQKQMRDEAAARQAEIEAAKSEEQRKREAAAEERKKKQDELDRQRIREQIEKDKERRNKEYSPLVEARKEMADDSDALSILSDTEPRDLSEWVSSLLRPHSLLWQDASPSEVGLQSELGLKRADMNRFMTLLGNKESNAEPFGKAVLDIYEALPEGIKNQVTDEDVRNTLLDLFNEGSSTRMMHLAEEHRIEEAREAVQENLRRAAEYELEQWAEHYHLTPEEREAFEDYLAQAPSEPEQVIINNIIADYEYEQSERSREEDYKSDTRADVSGSERGESQVRQTTEATGNGTDETGPAQAAEGTTGEPSVSDDALSGAGVIPTPAVDKPRLKALRRKLADAYSNMIDRGGRVPEDLQDVSDATVELRKYVDEGLDDYREYEDGIEDYDGLDPEKLADQYITRLYHDRYADDDADQMYIRTGLKPDMRESNTFVEYNGKKFEANDCGVCTNPNVIKNRGDKFIGYEIRTALSNMGWVGAYDVNGPTWGAGSGVSAGWYDHYFETEAECQAYHAQRALDYLKQYNEPRMKKYEVALQTVIDKVPKNTPDTDPVSGKEFRYGDYNQCYNPNLIRFSKGNYQYVVETAYDDGMWIGAMRTINRPMYSDGGITHKGQDAPRFETEQEAQAYYAQLIYDRFLEREDAKKIKPILKSLKDIINKVKPAEQLKPTDLRDAVRPESAKIGVAEANAKARYQLSATEKDAEGNTFFEKNGSIDLWSLTELFTKAGRQQAPIRLTDRNLQHIIDEHGKEIGDTEKVFEFLDDVFGNATVLRRARGRGMFVIVENDKTDKAAIIKLMPSETGDYYNVETAGYYRKNKWKENEDVIADLSEPSQSDAATDVSKPQTPDKNGKEPINADTQASSSEGKGTKNSANIQENQQESLQEPQNSFKRPGTNTPEGEILAKGGTKLYTNEGNVIQVVGSNIDKAKGERRYTCTLYENEDALKNDNPVTKFTISQQDMRNNLNNGTYSKERKAEQPQKNEPKRLVSDDRMAELKKKLRGKLGGQLNVGVDPEILAIGAEIAVGYIERGVTKFADFAKAMIDEVGDFMRPYLKSFYNAVRDMPEAQEYAGQMDSYEHVSKFDVAGFDKPGTATDAIKKAEQIVNEQKVAKQTKKIKAEQPDLFGDFFSSQQPSGAIGKTSSKAKRATEEAKVNTNPTEAQKEAGNYQKGHISVDGYDITIENPKGSIRRGVDASGKPWEVTMNNTYGYIRGTEGVDGDHIDVFLSDNPTEGEVFVVDQVKPDGSFDEHKVMYGFADAAEATKAYLANYSEGWTGLGAISGISREKFKEWVESSHRKTKPFREYALAKRAASYNEDGILLATAKEEDLDNPDAKFYYQGKPVHIMLVTRKGEQVSATKFSTPTVDSVHLTNGKSVKLEDLMVKVGEKESVSQQPVATNAKKKPNLDKKDFRSYMTPEAIEYFAEKFQKYTHKDLAFIEGAVRDKVVIPVEELAKIPGIVEAETKVKAAEAREPLQLTDQQIENYATRLLDNEHGSAVFENGRIRDVDGHEDFSGPVKQERKAFVIIGRPAGGKSSVFANPLSNQHGARIIDSDVVKEWLDGFDGGYGAGYVQDMSSKVADRALDIAVQNGDNIVLPRIGGNSVALMSAALRMAGYDVKLYYNDVVPETSYMRSSSRFSKSGRFLSLDYLTKISDKPSRFFSKFAEETLGDFIDERTEEQVQELRGRLERLVGSQQSDLLRALHGWLERRGREERDGSVSGNVERSESDGATRLIDFGTPIFSYAEWKSNDVSFGEKPKEIWNSESGLPMPTNERISNETERKVSAEPRTVGEGERQGSQSVDGLRADGSSEQNRSERSGSGSPVESKQTPKHNNRRNNVGERGVDYAPTSPKARFNANVEAIKLMRVLMDEGIEAPTQDQMEALRKFSGWGGLGTFFNDATTAEYRELRDLLSEEEYNDAAMSINSAYYTPAMVIDSLWDIAKAMGFKGGNVLEGSAGIGNIIGQMPKDMSRRSDIEAVEIDSITGNILKLLYPDAKVHIQGFQDTVIPNGSVDLAVTNVPFVTGLHVIDKVDKDLSRKFVNIHDFCIAKNIRKLREGGIGLFITSSGTLDKSTKLREWITDEGQADVVGAFRLNNKTFGGTTVTSDIIVVRKRVAGKKSPVAIDIAKASPLRVGTWTDKFGDEHQVSLTINDYFKDHPEMMAGEMAFGYEKGDTFRPGSYGLYPVDGMDQQKMLNDFAQSMSKAKEDIAPQQQEEQQPNQLTAEKEGRMLVDDKGRLCVSQRGVAVPLGLNDQKVKGYTKAECFADYQAVQKAVDDVLQQQLGDPDDAALKPKLDALNKAYDKFTKRYGTLHKNTAISFLRNDIDFPSFQALENYSETKDMKGKVTIKTAKTPLFTQRVLGFKTEPQPKTIKDAVISSIFRGNTIDLGWIGEKLGMGVDDVRKEILDSRLAFENPSTGQLEIRYKYLSGNVREKLAIAEGYNTDGRFSANVEELRKAVPMDIPSHLIEFSLGSSWIPVEIYKDYLKEMYDLGNVRLNHIEGTWVLDEGYSFRNEKNRSAGVYSEKFRETIYGHQLVAAALNNRPVKVSKQVSEGYGSNKTTKTVVDQAATQACAVRVDEIKDEFRQWAKKRMQEDPELAQRIEKIYNDKFNALVPMQIDEEFLPKTFEGANMNISLYEHQKRGVMRGLTAPTMLAHEVGTGKSFTLISTAMEMRRLGTAKKPMIVVQNATVAQITADAKLLYPNAKVLSLSEKDRSAEGRRAFYAKIKFNDWDLIIVPQSTFERIPDSPERELQFIQEKIDEKKHIIEAAEAAGMDDRELRRLKKELEKIEQEYGDTALDHDPANYNVPSKKKKKDAKKEAASLDKAETKAKEMLDRAVDDVQFFDDLGVDALLVDEAHEYKHLGFQTSIGRGIKGIDPSYSKKCAGLYNKTRSVFEKAGWKNVVFATGTPISNTAAEIWTFMKYLMPADVMRQNDIYYFDDFVHNFGNISQMLEFATSGKFKENTRFAAYVNKPELIRIWSQVADTVLTKEVGAVKEKVPEKEGGKDQDVFLPQSPSLIGIMAAVRAELERFENMDGKQKKENSHIPLTMYGIAKRAAIDPRLVNEDAPDEPTSKTNMAVKEIVKDLKDTKSYKGTVAVFCDNQNRKGADGTIDFNIYDDMREKLIAQGVPADQIAIIKSGMSIAAKQKVFDAVNSGAIRVVLGSTQTLGTGVNMQERLHLLIHMDAPDRPMDYTQRNGRIERQGNLHKTWGKPIRIVRFGVEDSLDVTAYQRLKTKSGFIDSIMDGKSALMNNQVDRTIEEEEEGLFDNPVAVLSGSQYALKKNQAERELRKYQGKKSQWEADQVYITNTLRYNKTVISSTNANIEEEEKKLAKIKGMFPDGKVKTITVEGVKIDMTKDDGAKKLSEAIKEKINDPVNATVKKLRENQIYNDENQQYTIELDGHAVNFTVSIYRTSEWDGSRMKTILHKGTQYSSPDLLTDSMMSARSVRDYLDEIIDDVVTGNDSQDRIDAMRAKIERTNNETEQLRQREGQPFQFTEQLEAAIKNVEEYTKLMVEEMKEKEAKYAAQQAEAKANGNTFDLNKAEENSEDDEDLYRIDDDMPWEDDEENPIFYSNAMQAVDAIRQDKAAPQQWLAMIVKNGGLKAGEDKWLGLSDWLNNSDKKSITKQEVKNFIRMNQIYVNETHYAGYEIIENIDKKYPGFTDAFFIEEDDFTETPSYSIIDLKKAVDFYNAHHPENYRIEIDKEGNVTDDEYDDLILYAEELFEASMKYEEVNAINPTRANYTTQGLEKNREIALTVPTIEPWNQQDSIHFGDAGEGRAIAWIRFGETQTYADNGQKRAAFSEIEKDNDQFYADHPDFAKYGIGDEALKKESEERKARQREAYDELNTIPIDKKVLVIDEIQSKRHQEGRKLGYKNDSFIGKADEALKELVAYRRSLYDKYPGLRDMAYLKDYATPEEIAKERELDKKHKDLERQERNQKMAPPDAPFEKNWQELAMKRMLRYAAENGYDKIAWTTGRQQAERYNIGKLISLIDVSDWGRDVNGYNIDSETPNDERGIYLHVKNKENVALEVNRDGIITYDGGEGYKGHTLAELVGKEVAQQILESEGKNRINNGDFRVDYEGMKGLYDDMLPRFMNKYGKKWGVSVSMVELPKLTGTARNMWSIDITPEMKESVMMGQPMFRDRDQFSEGETFPIFTTEVFSKDNVLGKRTVYSTDLMPDQYPSQQSLLNALREQYPSYYVTIEDGRVKVQTWQAVMADAINAQTARKVKGTESYVKRKTERAIDAVKTLADKMNVDVEVMTTTEGLTGKKARAKGWFNPKTHKIVIVLPNHANQSDVINTLLHEGVAHYGLRNMFGEHFDTFLDNVYYNVDPQIKARIDAAMKRNGWSRHTATEEYLARLAERTDFQHAMNSGWWQKIKDFFISMLTKAGFNTTLTDNELRYILWRSYDNLIHPDSRRNIFDTARDIDMQSRLKVGQYEEQVPLRPTAEATPKVAEPAVDEVTQIINDAKADGTYMKAPNGDPTNLNEEQWAQVRTKAFKNWFGDWQRDPENASKVVDENGEPAVMYHGTNLDAVNNGEPFYTFYPSSHFGTKGQAEDRADGKVKIYQVFLNIRNPQRRNDASQEYLEDHDMTMSEFWEQSVERAKGRGHDGVVYLNRYEDPENPADSWIALNPNQIKSATENNGEYSPENEDIRYSLRTKEPPKKTGIGYKVFVLKDRQLYPPMVANPNGEGTPIGVWLDADAAPVAGTSKTGRPQVKVGGKGTQGGSGQLAYRPGWHLGEIPYALQFNRKDENGERTLFPNNFVWAEVEYADDVDYNDEARQEGTNASGKYQHSLAGLKHVPTDGSYKYRTNPDPRTDPWIITGAMRVNKILSREEVDDLVRKAGREPQPIQEGDVLTQESIDALNTEIQVMKEADEMGLLYRDDDDWGDVIVEPFEDNYDVAREIYEKAAASDALKFQESWQDKMAGLKILQNAIEKETGRKATGAEDAYLYENRMHGKAKNQSEAFDRKYYQPILKAADQMMKAKGWTEIRQLTDYMVAKHGLERNIFYAFKEAVTGMVRDNINKEQAKLTKRYERGEIDAITYKKEQKALAEREAKDIADKIMEAHNDPEHIRMKEDYENGDITFADYITNEEGLRRKFAPDFDEHYRDYSGLTELTGDEQDYMTKALAMVEDAERDSLEVVDNLWSAVNAATKETLRFAYESGTMSRSTYNNVRAMFEYYIPLRGWEENNADDFYEYVSERNVFSTAIKKAYGRKSLAENPIAYIGNMAVSTLLAGHRNQLKQHFLNYVLNNPTSLVSVSEKWWENKGTETAPYWVEVAPEIPANATADEIADIVEAFNEEMEQKAAEGKATTKRGSLNIKYHATGAEKNEHMVEVQRAGKTYQLYINGNPKAAQALNGINEKAVSRISQTDFGKLVEKINRNMAAFFTSKNPAFVVSNLSRDLTMAGASVAIKEDAAYNAQFIKNVWKVLRPRTGRMSKYGIAPQIVRGLTGMKKLRGITGLMPSLMRKYLDGDLDLTNETERLFGEFMDEGAETGFVNMLSVDSFKEKMQKEITRMQGTTLNVVKARKGTKETPIGKGLRMMGDIFEFYNRCAEDATRFIVYMTSRQMGKSLEDSIADAKDVTLNFNRKGTGAQWNAVVRDLFIFVNPAIQAMSNMFKMAYKHPIKFTTVTAGFIAAGALMPIINQWLLNMFGDDDDKETYWNLPPWVRKNNLVMWIPGTKNFITIPLAQEFRVFYGLGEMATSLVYDHPVHNWPMEILSSFMDLVPINPTGNGGNLAVDLTPTMFQPLMQLNENIDFTGKPIWKENQGNKYAPMYTKAYVSTPEWMVDLSEAMNDLTGGNEGKKGAIEEYMWGGNYINNPAVWNHLMQGYFGGMYNTIAKGFDVITTTAKGEIPKVYQTPVINRYLNRPVERDNAGALGEQYYNLIEDRDRLKFELRTWKKKAEEGDEEAQAHVDEIMSSDDYQRMLVIDHYDKIMKDLKAGEKAATMDIDKADIKESIALYKQEMMEELAAIDGGEDPLTAAKKKFDEATTFAEKNRLRMRIEKLMMRQNGNTKKRGDEVQKALSYREDDDRESRKVNEMYLELATAENISDDARIRAAKAQIKQHTDKFKELLSQGRQTEAARYRENNKEWFAADAIIQSQSRTMANNKKLLGKGHDGAIMKLIDLNRSQMLKAIENLP